MATEHILKIHPEHFQAVVVGRKRAEIRFNDRGYEVGDTLVLKEFDLTTSEFTGRETSRLVTHILSGDEWLREGYVALSICETQAKTYDEKNTEIINLLRLSGSPADIYAAQRIEDLETEVATLRRQAEIDANIIVELSVEAGLIDDGE